MAEEIWLEKYRPQTLDEVYGNEDIVYKLKRIQQDGNIPNMILNGPPGVGKTSSIISLAKFMLGNQYKEAVLELNASDDRGLEVVRDKIKFFANKKVNLELGKHKIVILDEADSLTEGAQQALRMIIMDYADTTRFILSCNDSKKLIDAIQSRCAILRFTKLSDDEIRNRILQIMQKENIQHDKDGLDCLLFTTDGDMRQAINNLQATFTGFGKLTREYVLKVCDIPNLDIIEKVIKFMNQGDFINAQNNLYPLWIEGYSAYDLVNTIQKLILASNYLVQNIQYEFLKDIGQLKLRVLEGQPTFLQISGYMAKCCQNAMEWIKSQQQFQ